MLLFQHLNECNPICIAGHQNVLSPQTGAPDNLSVFSLFLGQVFLSHFHCLHRPLISDFLRIQKLCSVVSPYRYNCKPTINKQVVVSYCNYFSRASVHKLLSCTTHLHIKKVRYVTDSKLFYLSTYAFID